MKPTFLLFALCFLLSACSDPDYTGLWFMRGHNVWITITHEDNIFQVAGPFAFNGGYVLDDQGRIVNLKVDSAQFEYDAAKDILTWHGNKRWTHSEVFERPEAAGKTTDEIENYEGSIVECSEAEAYPDTNGLEGTWTAQFDFYAGFETATLVIRRHEPSDTCGEYQCTWWTSNAGSNKTVYKWCGHMNTGVLEADMQMSKRQARMYAVKQENGTLSVSFLYESAQYLPWRLEFSKK